VAAPVGRQATSVWSSSSESRTGGKVCYLPYPRLPCLWQVTLQMMGLDSIIVVIVVSETVDVSRIFSFRAVRHTGHITLVLY